MKHVNKLSRTKTPAKAVEIVVYSKNECSEFFSDEKFACKLDVAFKGSHSNVS